MSRQELADACNETLAASGGARRRAGLDASTIGAYEQGSITWPNADYRAALRVVFSSTDGALGFYAARRPRTPENTSIGRWPKTPCCQPGAPSILAPTCLTYQAQRPRS